MTNLVKRKKPAEGEASNVSEHYGVQSNGKRKVDFFLLDNVEEMGAAKRGKVSDDIQDY